MRERMLDSGRTMQTVPLVPQLQKLGMKVALFVRASTKTPTHEGKCRKAAEAETDEENEEEEHICWCHNGSKVDAFLQVGEFRRPCLTGIVRPTVARVHRLVTEAVERRVFNLRSIAELSLACWRYESG